jgi:putative endonuclease
MVFFVYMLRCRDGSLYTGITNDLKKRMEQHSRGRGSKYVRARRPFRLVYTEDAGDKSSALKREIEIKRLSRQEKIRLLNTYFISNRNNNNP